MTHQFSEIDIALQIKQIVKEKYVSETDLNFIRKQLKNDNPLPIVDLPLHKIAVAALHVLKVEKYRGKDEQTIAMIEFFETL